MHVLNHIYTNFYCTVLVNSVYTLNRYELQFHAAVIRYLIAVVYLDYADCFAITADCNILSRSLNLD